MKPAALLALFSLFLQPVARAGTSPQEVAHDITVLADQHIVSDADYWRQNLVEGGRCEGEKVVVLLTELANMLEPKTAAADALSVLATRGIIGTPDYWEKHAVAGGICDARNVQILFNRTASRLPIPIPDSANATQLPVLPAEKMSDH